MGYRIATFYRITIDTFHIATITNDTSAIKSNYQTIFDLPTVFSPDAAPSTGGFERIRPQGRCRDASRFSRGLGSPFEKPRSNPRSAGSTRHGVSFLLGTFLWTSKEKYLGCRAETRLL